MSARALQVAVEAARAAGEIALKYYRAGFAVSLKPEQPSFHYNLGRTLEGLDRLSEAECSYEAALKLAPDLGPAHLQLGRLYLRQGRPALAVARFETVLRLHPNSAQARKLLEEARDQAAKP